MHLFHRQFTRATAHECEGVDKSSLVQHIVQAEKKYCNQSSALLAFCEEIGVFSVQNASNAFPCYNCII